MVRTVGVEEELLLVDMESGFPRSVSGRILERGRWRGRGHGDGSGGSLDHELQQQQLETDTPPESDMARLDLDIREWRDTAIAEAREVGARIVAAATSPMPVEPRMVRKPRFDDIGERFGLTASEQLTCGCHVHVSVDSDDEAVAVLDRIRIWLPSILALSANSPFWQGVDTRYASYRSQAIIRWPTAGPNDVFGSTDDYRRLVSRMTESGVLVDEGMIYFDARVSHRYPTVEIRVADVCLDARDTVLIAALSRGLVETASREWKSGEPPHDESTAMLRLSMWQAGRTGAEGILLDPLAGKPLPVRDVVDQLVDHIGPALRESGDDELVRHRLAEIWERGTGASRQRRVLERTGQLRDVVADLVRVTAGQDG